jgi:hypothetical protein
MKILDRRSSRSATTSRKLARRSLRDFAIRNPLAAGDVDTEGAVVDGRTAICCALTVEPAKLIKSWRNCLPQISNAAHDFGR